MDRGTGRRACWRDHGDPMRPDPDPHLFLVQDDIALAVNLLQPSRIVRLPERHRDHGGHAGGTKRAERDRGARWGARRGVEVHELDADAPSTSCAGPTLCSPTSSCSMTMAATSPAAMATRGGVCVAL